MEYVRLDNESEEELIYRVCSQKEILNQSWQEIANILNNLLGNEYTESKYRKQYQAFNKMLNANKDKFTKDNNYSKELQKQYDDIKAERIKLQTCNIERNRLDRQKARQELWYEQISEYIKTLEVPKFCNNQDIQENEIKYIQTLSDIHFGAEFVSINNQYSPKIVYDRMELLKNKTIKFIKDKNISELTIVGLSDYIQGILRLNDLRINNTTVVKSAVNVAELVSVYLNDLSEFCNIVYYDSVFGNHSEIRYLGSQPNAMMNEDLGYVISKIIEKSVINNPRIKIIIPNEEDTFLEVTNIFDFNIIIGHGHQIKNINNSLKDLSMQRRKFYDYLILGHFHNDRNICINENDNYDTEILIAPSICGSDPYSDSLFKGSKSASAIYGFDKKYGHIETYKIILN